MINSHRSRRGHVVILLAAVVCLVPAMRGGLANDAWTRAVAFYRSQLAQHGIVGSSLLVMKAGEITGQAVDGLMDRDANRAVDQDTIFHWASITKTLNGIAMMQLRDRGLLSLEDPVTRLVPELRLVHNEFGSMDAITIRMLLNHSAGFQAPTWPYKEGAAWEPFEPTRWEQLVAMMPYQELLFTPGSRFGYSNPSFIYLARVIEQLTGDPYQSYIQKNIWTPLGMTRSYFGATPYHLARWRSNNYALKRDSTGERVVANGRDFDPGITIPNGGWNAPLADVVTWIGFLTGAPAADTALARRHDGVLSRRTIAEMWRPVVALPAGDDLGAAAGLSFFLFPSGTDTLVGHTGEQAGFRSFFYLNPRTRTAVIAAFNTVNDARPAASTAAWSTITRRGLAVVK